MSKIKCPWCDKEVSIEEYSIHFDSHKDPAYDRKLIEESRNKHEPPPLEIDSEMAKFAWCVAEKLTPLPQPGECPSGPTGAIARTLKRRMDFERELYAVLLGEKTLEAFFSDATQSWDMDKRKLSQMFYDCLKGLHSKEARKVRKQWEMFLRHLSEFKW